MKLAIYVSVLLSTCCALSTSRRKFGIVAPSGYPETSVPDAAETVFPGDNPDSNLYPVGPIDGIDNVNDYEYDPTTELYQSTTDLDNLIGRVFNTPAGNGHQIVSPTNNNDRSNNNGDRNGQKRKSKKGKYKSRHRKEKVESFEEEYEYSKASNA